MAQMELSTGARAKGCPMNLGPPRTWVILSTKKSNRFSVLHFSFTSSRLSKLKRDPERDQAPSLVRPWFRRPPPASSDPGSTAGLSASVDGIKWPEFPPRFPCLHE